MLTHGILASSVAPGMKLPPEAIIGTGFVPFIARLNVPALKETDASLGVS